jgi:hypothetical protein
VWQVGQEPTVGRREGVALLGFLRFSVLRKCVARQVRWVLLVQDDDGQVRVLAPESGSGEEQRVQFWEEARRACDFSM